MVVNRKINKKIYILYIRMDKKKIKRVKGEKYEQ